MSIIVGNVEFHAGPTQVGAPDDLETVIVNFIDGAQSKLDIAVQELESRPIADAIISARQRGVTVKVVIEQDYLSVKRARQQPYVSGGDNEENRLIQNAIYRANIDLKCDYNTSVMSTMN